MADTTICYPDADNDAFEETLWEHLAHSASGHEIAALLNATGASTQHARATLNKWVHHDTDAQALTIGKTTYYLTEAPKAPFVDSDELAADPNCVAYIHAT